MTVELILGWLCALLIGYSINQGGTCGVAAARDLVYHRRIDRFAGCVAATGAAGLVFLPAIWLLGIDTMLGGMAAIAPGLFIGAALLGIGTVINDACMLGSLWRLGNGELRFLALPVGLAAGFILTSAIPGARPHVAPNALIHPALPGFMVVGVSGLVLVAALIVLSRLPRRRPDRWPLSNAMMLLGVTGALLYVLQPGWTYADAVRRGVLPMTAIMMESAHGALAALLTVVGAMLSAVRLGVFRPLRPNATEIFRSLGGGVLIAMGATMIPGGNDTLLLAAVPAGSVSGGIAFTTMTIVVVATMAMLKRARPNPVVSGVD